MTRHRIWSNSSAPLYSLLLAAIIVGGFLFAATPAHAIVKTESGTITTSTVWTSTSTHYIPTSVIVGSGGTLTINSGTAIKFGSNAYFDIAAGGTLKAFGAATSKITFTSINDNSVGSNVTGTTGNPAKGDWGYIEVDSGASSTIANTMIRYGGGVSAQASNIYTYGGSLTLSSVTVASSTGNGLYIEGSATSTASVTTSTFSNNGSDAIFENNSPGTLTLTSSSFNNNAGSVANVDFQNGFTFIPSGNTAAGTSTRGFVLSVNNLNGNIAWYKDLAYVLNSSLSVHSGTLTINHGAVIKFSTTCCSLDIDSGAALNVQGTSTDKVYFTSFHDNSIAPGTNGTTTNTAAPGDWLGLTFEPGSSSTINNAIIRFAGGNALENGSLWFDGGNIRLFDSEVASSARYGAYNSLSYASTSLLAINNSFHNNSSGDYSERTVTSTMYMEGNYWGSSSGPNSGGNADTVGSYIDDSHWLTSWVSTSTTNGTTTLYWSNGSLNQYQSDGVTPLAEGALVILSPVKFEATLQSTGTSTVQLQVEVEPSSTAFINSSTVASPFVSPGTSVTVSSSILTSNDYHWQARMVDSHGASSAWQLFGVGPNSIDFTYVSAPTGSFYAQIENTSNGRFVLRSTTSTSIDPDCANYINCLERLPQDWVVYVSSTVDKNGNPIIADNNRWYDVVDPTDNVEGWMPGASATTSLVYLTYSSSTQSSLISMGSSTLSIGTSSGQTGAVVASATDFYYNNTSTMPELYSSDNPNNVLSMFKDGVDGANTYSGFPEQIILGMAVVETGGIHFDNTFVQDDYGSGIMQLTPLDVLNHEPTTTLEWASNTENIPADGSFLEIYPCAMQATDTYINCYQGAGTGSTSTKPYMHYAGNLANPKYMYYGNTQQSIYANIKDGMRVLQDSYYFSPITTSSLPIASTTYSPQEREVILALASYGARCFYVDQVANATNNINNYFPGFTSSSISDPNMLQNMMTAGTDDICASLYSPATLSIQDANGRTVGISDGQAKNDFPLAVYSPNGKRVEILAAGTGDYTYKVTGTGAGTYGFAIAIKHGNQAIIFSENKMPIISGEIDTYSVDTNAILNGQNGVMLKVDTKGDGTIDRTEELPGAAVVDLSKLTTSIQLSPNTSITNPN